MKLLIKFLASIGVNVVSSAQYMRLEKETNRLAQEAINHRADISSLIEYRNKCE